MCFDFVDSAQSELVRLGRRRTVTDRRLVDGTGPAQ